MGRPPCCDKSNVKRGLWTAEEDAKILAYVASHGVGNWTLVPQKAGLNRCGKSCRLRWTNYLRPDLKHEGFTAEEEDYIIELHRAVGSRWSLIAKQLPGRTDNDVKNYWNTKLKKKLVSMGIDPITHKPISRVVTDCHNIINLTTQAASYNRLRDQASLTMSNPCFFPSAPCFSDFNCQALMQTYVPQSPTASSSSSSCTVNQPVESFPASTAQVYSFSWIDHVLQDNWCINDDLDQSQGGFSDMPVSAGLKLGEADAEKSKTVGATCNPSKAYSSSCSVKTFVDNILDRDFEIMSDCPRLLDESFEY
uniref:Uncharacterized protein n=1 Tax=Kalanchoe fedtschenkoi TaxID=63787 RepID=A0A7N0SW98_KALFE